MPDNLHKSKKDSRNSKNKRVQRNFVLLKSSQHVVKEIFRSKNKSRCGQERPARNSTSDTLELSPDPNEKRIEFLTRSGP
ncbi:hypothetical protein TNCV_4943201 [Trichonephila clavipes]|nr:hypothetical protein TNCV_4943201 [Trichonephila clavipes]